MLNRDKKKYSRSSIYPEIIWQDLTQLFVVVVPKTDESLIEFIAKGVITVEQLSNFSAEVVIRLGLSPLVSQLKEAALVRGKLKPSKQSESKQTEIKVYFHGAMYLPDKDKIAALVGAIPPSSPQQIFITPAARQKAAELFEAWNREKDLKRKKYEDFIDKLSREQQESFQRAESILGNNDDHTPKLIADQETISAFSSGILVCLSGKTISSINTQVISALENSCLAPPRDGEHNGLLLKGDGRRFSALVTWEERNLPSPYPEMKASVHELLPSAFYRPRRSDIKPPFFELPDDNPTILHVQDINGLIEQNVDWIDLEERAEKARTEIKKSGMDALGWYQSYHVWNDATWGIYLHGNKIYDFACALMGDLRKAGENSSQLAMNLALQLIYQHELFHAKIEACLTWLELTALRPKYLKYKSNVYQATKGTADWLEEALANWSSAEWAKNVLPGLKERGMINNQKSVEEVIYANLDLSPPGYRDWRNGLTQRSGRALTSELVNGKPANCLPKHLLPVESLLPGQLPFDFIANDIPTRIIIGSGVIVDISLCSPAIFATPTVREMGLALKYMGYVPQKNRGKGSHTMWKGDDKRGFLVPQKDPLSKGVFKSFLHHFGIDKIKYVKEIRPKL